MELDLDLRDASAVIDVLEDAADANLDDPRRAGSVVEPPNRGTLVVTGDLHDNLAHLGAALRLADLDASPDHHLVLHEVIHGGRLIAGRDLSFGTLARIAALKVRYPAQVVMMPGNHELAQLLSRGIVKNGTYVVEAFDAGLDHLYGEDADGVRRALSGLIRSMPLAIRCCDRSVFIAHSLPGPKQIDGFDATVLDRVPTADDYAAPHGPVYRLVWGRKHTHAVVEAMREATGASAFVLGHQAVERGYTIEHERVLILNSDHDRGKALPLPLDQPLDGVMGLVERLVGLSGG